MRVIARAVADAQAGDGGVLVIRGSSGIGKTALLSEVTRDSRRRGMQVLPVFGGEVERDMPLTVMHQLAAGLGEAAVPALGGLWETIDAFRRRLVTLAAVRPLAVVVDDVDAVDAASLKFLEWLARRVDGTATLLAVAAQARRSEERTLDRIAAVPGTNVLGPKALSTDAVTTLVRDRWAEADTDFCRACHHATAGNPALVKELLAVVAAEGLPPTSTTGALLIELEPCTIARGPLVRLAHSSRAARALAQAAAVLGDGTPLGLSLIHI